MKKSKDKKIKRNVFYAGTVNKNNLKRKNDLSQELKLQLKSNVFSDNRIGENNLSLDENKKLIKRLAAQKKKQFKQNIFNLNDDNDDFIDGDEDLGMAYALSDDEDDGITGNIGSDVVKSSHFGGGMFSQKDEQKDGGKSRKDWIEQMILESRKKRMESKQEKTHQDDLVQKLNEKSQIFEKIVARFQFTDDDKDQVKANCEYSSYDKAFKAFSMDNSKRAYPTDRTKSEEEKKEELRKKFDQDEKELLQRMKAPEEIEMERELVNAPSIEDIEPAKKKKTLESLEIDESEEEIESDDGINVSNVSKPVEDEENNNNMERKKKENDVTGGKSNQEKETKKTEKDQTECYNVPEDERKFWKRFKGLSPQQYSDLVGKMISLNHPTTGKSVDVCARLFAFLLHTLNKLSIEKKGFNKKYSRYDYFDAITPHLVPLCHLFPARSANIINDIIDEKIQKFIDGETKVYPRLDTCIFLMVADLIYPASDFIHDVMTRVKEFACYLLDKCELLTRRDITAALLIMQLVHKYIHRSERFVPEIVHTIRLILSMAVNSEHLDDLKIRNFVKYNPNSLICTGEKLKSIEIPRFKLIWLNNDTLKINKKFKLMVINECLILLSKFAKSWNHSLPVLSMMFEPIVKKISIAHPTIQRRVKNVLDDLSGEYKSVIRPKKEKVRVFQTLEPVFTDDPLTVQMTRRTKIKHKIRRDKKSLRRKMAKDQRIINKINLDRTIASDAVRRKKVNIIMDGLSHQEGDYQKLQKKKR